MPDSVELQLDRATAEDLRDALHLLGEHIAAGRPIPQFPSETNARLGSLLSELDRRLGGPGRFA